MPFVSKSQQRLCFSLKSKGKAGNWNCKEWAGKTNQKTLPVRVKQKGKK